MTSRELGSAQPHNIVLDLTLGTYLPYLRLVGCLRTAHRPLLRAPLSFRQEVAPAGFRTLGHATDSRLWPGLAWLNGMMWSKQAYAVVAEGLSSFTSQPWSRLNF